MICGYCFAEMKSGLITFKKDSLRWEPDKNNMNLLTESIKNGYTFRKNKIKAYICPKCNKIIIDLNRLDF